MGFDCRQFAGLITRVLKKATLFSPGARNLLLATAAVESDFGTYLRQKSGGPALGVFQMEQKTEKDLWEHAAAKGYEKRIRQITGVTGANPGFLETHLDYQILMARLYYLRIHEPLPEHNDICGICLYWKTHWNTFLGKGRIKDCMEKYRYYVLQPGKLKEGYHDH